MLAAPPSVGSTRWRITASSTGTMGRRTMPGSTTGGTTVVCTLGTACAASPSCSERTSGGALRRPRRKLPRGITSPDRFDGDTRTPSSPSALSVAPRRAVHAPPVNTICCACHAAWLLSPA